MAMLAVKSSMLSGKNVQLKVPFDCPVLLLKERLAQQAEFNARTGFRLIWRNQVLEEEIYTRLSDLFEEGADEVDLDMILHKVEFEYWRCSNKAQEAINNRPLPRRGGVASFEVMILHSSQDGHIGVELGVCVNAKDRYVTRGSFLYKNDERMALKQWRSTSPRYLEIGETVHFAVLYSGAIVITLGNEEQARWEVGIDPKHQLTTIVAIQDPCKSVEFRLPREPV
mmetsp:Transcript_32010/g.73076  ORF Transcript_32010/g.73076 Transcript_32010/m.73076 type:complete len:226 (-) Transcript_32010:310-987(-)